MSEAFSLLLKNIAKLFKVKTILSLLVIITTCILTFKNVVSVEAFMSIAASIITYYFTKKEDTEEVVENTKDKEITEETKEIIENKLENEAKESEG